MSGIFAALVVMIGSAGAQDVPAAEVARAIIYAAGTATGTAPELIALNPHGQI